MNANRTHQTNPTPLQQLRTMDRQKQRAVRRGVAALAALAFVTGTAIVAIIATL